MHSTVQVQTVPPIRTPAAWVGKDLIQDPSWRWSLSPTEVDVLVGSARALAARGGPHYGFAAAEFSAHGLSPLLQWLADTLERGPGVARVAGLPVEKLDPDDQQRIFWGLCAHLGTPVYQTWEGEIVRRVEDLSGGQKYEYQKPNEGAPLKSARTISASAGGLRFHTDKTDLLALMCASNGMEGGLSKIVSSVAIRNEIGRQRPDLLAVLQQPFWRMRPLDEEGEQGEKVFAMPVFSVGPRGDFTSQYSRSYVNQAQEVEGVPSLTPEQNEAMDLMQKLGDELCMELPFAAGEMQFMNQHVTYHGRTAFRDDPSNGSKRLLYRIWLTPPNSRELPSGHEVQWGTTQAGALRGGASPGHSPLVNPL